MDHARWLLPALLLVATASSAFAQTAQVRRLENNRYEVIVGNDTLVAFPDSALRRMLLEKSSGDAARKLVTVQDSLLVQYDRTANACTLVQRAAHAYVTSLQEQVADYEKLAENYRKLLRSAAPRFSIVGGVGATGSDTEPALMAGVEIGKLRLLWFGQEGNPGVLAGGSFRIF
jgi:hypothetical protein